MVTQLKGKPRCPESIQTSYYPVAKCNLNDKPCVLESGWTCPYYEEFLQKVEEE